MICYNSKVLISKYFIFKQKESVMFETILYSVENDLATISLNRPEVSNGFNIPMCQEILAALEDAEKNEEVKFIILFAELVNTISKKIKQLPKPVIMVADGAVAGAAANIAVAVDFCIISDRTKFIQAFVGVGLAPDAGGLFLLGKAIGMSRATHLVMTGEALTAEKAFDYGLAYRVCESEKLDKTVEQLLKKLRRGSSNSYAAMKEMVWEAFLKEWDQYAGLELDLQKKLAFTEDFKEGVIAYSEKRRPQFKGK